MTQQQLYCQDFREILDELRVDAEELSGPFSKLQVDLDDTDFNTKADALDKKRVAFFEFYKTQARKLLTQWYKKISFDEPQEDEFMAGIDFDPTGRAILLYGIATTKERVEYFPSIIKRIEFFNASIDSTAITSIDYLEEVEGNMELRSCRNLASLKRLRRVGGITTLPYSLLYAPELTETGFLICSQTAFPKLKTVHGGVQIVRGVTDNKPFFPELTRIERGIDVYTLGDFEVRDVFPKLEKVGTRTRNGTSITVPTQTQKAKFEALRGNGIEFDGAVETNGME